MGIISSARTYLKGIAQRPKEQEENKEPEKDLTSGKDKASVLVQAGRQKYNAGDYVTAEKCFRSAYLEDQDCQLAVTYMGNALYKLGKLDVAALVLRRSLEMDPDSYAGQKALQRLQRIEQKTGKAILSEA